MFQGELTQVWHLDQGCPPAASEVPGSVVCFVVFPFFFFLFFFSILFVVILIADEGVQNYEKISLHPKTCATGFPEPRRCLCSYCGQVTRYAG